MVFDSIEVVGFFGHTIGYKTDDNGRHLNGKFEVLFEVKGKRYEPASMSENFSDGSWAFITRKFSEYKRQYQNKLVKIRVKLDANERNFDTVDNNISKWVLGYEEPVAVKARDIVQVVKPEIFNTTTGQVGFFSNVLIFTPFIFLDWESRIYGPFSVKSKEEDLSLVPQYDISQINDESIDTKAKFNILTTYSSPELYELDSYFSVAIKPDDHVNFLTNLDDLSKAGPTFNSFIPDNVLINILLKELGKSTNKIQPALKLQMIKAANEDRLLKDHIDRIKKVFENIDNASEDVSSISKEILKTSEGKNFAEKIVLDNFELYLGDKKNKAKELQRQFEEDFQKERLRLTEELKTLQDQALAAKSELVQLKRESERVESGESVKNIIKEASEKAQNEIKKLSDERDKVAVELDALYSEMNMAKDITALKDEISYLERKKKELELENSKAKELAKLDVNELRVKLIELRPFVDTITGAPLARENSIRKLTLQNVKRMEAIDSLPIDVAYEYIESVRYKYYTDYDRNISFAVLASIYVSQFQSMFSILSGPSGIGKTSFVRLMQSIEGIGDRFIEIPVGRGWTSERDLIGFHNPLTDNFSPSHTGMYEYLVTLKEHNKTQGHRPIILLDEGNLSAIEHYGSMFLNMSDRESLRMTNIKHEGEPLSIPSDIHIFLTVNHDLTTEVLSPRFVDRAFVFNRTVFELIDDEPAIQANFEAYCSESMSSWFGADSLFKQHLGDDTKDKLNNLYEILGRKDHSLGAEIHINHRKRKSVLNFISVLSPLLSKHNVSDFKHSSLNQSIDLAVSLLVLPAISGAGAEMALRLSKLLQYFEENEFSVSTEILADIISRGKINIETYNYFMY